MSETTALGAAYMAGLATGLWDNQDDLRRNLKVDRVFKPGWVDEQREKAYRGWLKAVDRARDLVDKSQ